MHKRALYNLIQLNVVPLPTQEVHLEPWQKENYRLHSTHHLFESLKKVGLSLNEQEFELLGKNLDTPEQLAEALSRELSPIEQDFVYLNVFELWRRYFHAKRSLTLFCDELDHQICNYEEDEEAQATSDLQDSVAYLQNILDNHVDDGIDAKLALPLIQGFCAHDLEKFLYVYIEDRIDKGNFIYAKELLEGFLRYVKHPVAFNFLAARIELEETEESYKTFEKLLLQLKEDPNLDLNLEILSYLAKKGSHILFASLAFQIFPLLKTEQDLVDFGTICTYYLYTQNLENAGRTVEELLEHSQGTTRSLSLADPRVLELRRILKIYCPAPSDINS